MSVWENLSNEIEQKIVQLGSEGLLHEVTGAEGLVSNLFGLMSIQSQLCKITGENFMGVWQNLADEVEAKLVSLGVEGSLNELVGAESLTSNLFGLMCIQSQLSLIIGASSPSAGGGKLLGFDFNRLTTVGSQSLAADTQTAISGLEITYTPVKADSLILITVEFNGTAYESALTTDESLYFGLLKDSTPIGNIGSTKFFAMASRDAYSGGFDSLGGIRIQCKYQYVDVAGSTSARTYKATAWNENEIFFYINRDTSNNQNYASLITIQEIAA